MGQTISDTADTLNLSPRGALDSLKGQAQDINCRENDVGPIARYSELLRSVPG